MSPLSIVYIKRRKQNLVYYGHSRVYTHPFFLPQSSLFYHHNVGTKEGKGPETHVGWEYRRVGSCPLLRTDFRGFTVGTKTRKDPKRPLSPTDLSKRSLVLQDRHHKTTQET